MISAFAVREGVLGPLPDVSPTALPADALWVDLLAPTEEEEAVERLLGVAVPTRQEMAAMDRRASAAHVGMADRAGSGVGSTR